MANGQLKIKSQVPAIDDKVNQSLKKFWAKTLKWQKFA
jgi:uncharacterized protein YggU (UPF0235/DUF167 family)